MSHLRFSKWYAGCLSVWAAGVALPAQAQMDTFGGNPDSNAFLWIPKDKEDWTKHFRLGALVGMNISASFAMKGSFGISGNNPAAGIFDDGYILKDASGDTTTTANWGYNSASQLSANTLTMHSASAFSAAGSSETDGGFLPGLDLAYGGNLWYWKHARVGWELGIDWLPVEIRDQHPLSASVDQATYQFSLGGVQGIPAAPYHGDPSGNGVLIPYPAGFAPSSVTANASGMVTGSHTLDVNLYTLRLGPSFYWDLTQQVGLSLGAGPAVGLVEGDYKYDEFVTVNNVTARNTGRISGTDLVYGAYVNAAVMYHLEENGDIYLGAQYMPMGKATISGGGRTGHLNLGGQLYLSVGVNWPF